MTEPMPPLCEPAATGPAPADAGVNRRVRDLDLYLGLLADAVRARGGHARQVREVVGEVRGHCLHTQDDPVETFGLPEQYASARFRPLTWQVVVGRLFAGLGSAVGVMALVAALVPRQESSGSVLTVSDLTTGLMTVNVLVAVPWLVYGLERSMLPRWIGRRAVARWAWVIRAAVLVVLSAAVLAMAWSIDPQASGRSVLAGPRWAFFATALVLLPLVWVSGPSARSVPGHPRSPYGVAGGFGGRAERARRHRAADWFLGRAR